MIDYLHNRAWGIRLMAVAALLFLPIFVLFAVFYIAKEDGFFDDFGGMLRDVARSLRTGRLN